MLDLPLEYALIEFKDATFSGEIVPELLDLAQRRIVRFVDIVFIQKDGDGTTRTLELNDLDPDLYQQFVPIGEHVSSLFTTDDLADCCRQAAAEFRCTAPAVGEPVDGQSAPGHRRCRRPVWSSAPRSLPRWSSSSSRAAASSREPSSAF